MKVGGGSKIVEKNKSRKGVEKNRKIRCVEYSTVGYKVVTTFIIIFKMCRRKSMQ
jgi:hypothetical protein